MSEPDKQRVTIFFPKELLEKIDDVSRKSYLKRSQWIIQAVTEKIREEEKKEM